VTVPFVSAVIPCRNERTYIAACLESVIQSTYPRDRLEILVADGMSDDGTREVVHEYVKRDGRVILLDNPKRILASAWNTGIRAARGDIIVALNAHTVFPPDYIPKCVAHMERFPDAAYVGGVVKTLPQHDTALGRALALAVSHPFGVGGSRFRTGAAEPVWADTAAFGGYRKALFDEIGLFNEDLVRSQDMELHLRFKKAGKKILLVPAMVGEYYTRTRMAAYLRYCFINGLWLTLPLRFSPHMLSPRHSVPMVFVLALAGSAVLGLLDPRLWLVTALTAVVYAIANVGAAIMIAWQRRDVRYAVLMPMAFAALHVLYGSGAVVGVVLAVCSPRFWRNLRDQAVTGHVA
jgi:glycosyltransferase involved in cell wall biosynthesis